jgi:NRAMP (natural resistance-associated macrophage protein)-like metal ion transporter
MPKSHRRRSNRVTRTLRRFGSLPGPGVITGASDDDPSGIATYSVTGAQTGYALLWTSVASLPLNAAVQEMCARIGLVTGGGLASVLRRHYSRRLLLALVSLLFIANTVNIGADIAAMGAASELVLGWGAKTFTVVLALASLGLQLFVPYHRYVKVLKWLTLALFAYVGVIFTVHIDWPQVLTRTVLPQLKLDAAAVTVIVAVFGTTISPYLFFWQSSEEVEDLEAGHQPDLLDEQPAEAREQLDRMGFDTLVGMALSNLVAFFIILTTAVTLHAHGVTDIQTSAQAAQALKPIAGPLAFALFALGIIGTGLLAVPVLAGSSAYAVAETFGWKSGLEKQPWQEPRFYAVIVAGMVIALGVVFSPLDPIKALFWSAVVNGVISVPIMAAMMVVASRRKQMGRYVATDVQKLFGWAATLVMAVAVITMAIFSR